MDLNAIKSKLNSLQQKPGQGNNNNRSLFWKPPIGKQVIRILPNKFNKQNPFTEVYMHYGIGDARTMISPINFGEKDPIVEFGKQLRQTSDKDNWRMAKKLDPKMRVFAPIVVRGLEHEGPKLWQFGKEIYLELLSMADDDDIGDYTDIHEGRDITVDTVGPDVTGTAYNKSSVRVKTKQTPLGDADQIQNWLDNQKNPTEVFKRYSYEEMKANLAKFLNPEAAEEEGSIQSEAAVPFDTDGPGDNNTGTSYTPPTTEAPKQNKVDKFDDLFG